MHQWPDGWWERYNELNYGRFDPALHRVLQSRDPFRWTETRSPNLKRDQVKVLDEAGDFGLRDGLIVPIHDT
ncbi:autoinducer binding domain-containing protein, partial [Acinetobacter baumannii]|uniref:autoinducer binding domain-containing protein n=1 Tax=Acinetobacter baumannii TaxID=470 RepID=UPI0014902927